MNAAVGGTVNILGVEVSTASPEAAAAIVVSWCEGGGQQMPRHVCATSVHGLVEGVRDLSFREILNRADLVAADGIPLVWFGRLRGHRGMERTYGPGVLARVCELSAGHPIRHFFYGGAPGVADLLAQKLAVRFPGLQVAGTFSPPYRTLTDEETLEVARRINQTAADIVWVGLSTPKQERWVDGVRRHLTVRVLVTVGAAFDFHAGLLRQAPRWIQRAGLEWLFRLTQEPRRLWRRYAYNNPTFLVLAGLQLCGLMNFSSRAGESRQRAG